MYYLIQTEKIELGLRGSQPLFCTKKGMWAMVLSKALAKSGLVKVQRLCMSQAVWASESSEIMSKSGSLGCGVFVQSKIAMNCEWVQRHLQNDNKTRVNIHMCISSSQWPSPFSTRKNECLYWFVHAQRTVN